MSFGMTKSESGVEIDEAESITARYGAFEYEAARASVFVGPDLRVHPCSTWERPLGNLRDFGFDLATLLKSEVSREARREIAAERCPGCWTPCDAAPTLLARLPEASVRALRSAWGPFAQRNGGGP